MPAKELARRDPWALRKWTGDSVLLRHDGDDLNEAEAIVLDTDTLRWLVTTGGPAALAAVAPLSTGREAQDAATAPVVDVPAQPSLLDEIA